MRIQSESMRIDRVHTHIKLNRFQIGSILNHFHRWFESGSKWIVHARTRTSVIRRHGYGPAMCSSPHVVHVRPVTRLTWLNASDRVNGAMATGWSTEATRALVSVWSQENVQSELDGVSKNRRFSNEFPRS